MASIKEELKAIIAGESPAIIRVNKKQRDGMPESKLEMILRYILKIAAITSFTVLVLNADIWKLVAIGLIAFFVLLLTLE